VKRQIFKKVFIMQIRISVIPAAGLGTRFLPLTKSVPKELLPILNKPSIQYILDEIHASGINEICIITSDRKQALEHYLSHDPALENQLAHANKLEALSSINSLIDALKFHYVVQHDPRGLGHAVSLAREKVNHNFFGVLLPDDIIANKTPALAQLIAVAQEHNATVVAVQEVPQEQTSSYGVVAIKHAINDHTFAVSHLVEKPKPEEAPSNLAIIGRYILSPRIFEMLEKTKAGKGGEIQLTDALDLLARSGEPVLACKISGDRFDVGIPQGWVKAVEYYARQQF
jgi:UTP--glucose-1-phosphate uridylyltransferase